jgi:hypothetical protein
MHAARPKQVRVAALGLVSQIAKSTHGCLHAAANGPVVAKVLGSSVGLLHSRSTGSVDRSRTID